jgi:adenylylsulfate kinase-like enzyme
MSDRERACHCLYRIVGFRKNHRGAGLKKEFDRLGRLSFVLDGDELRCFAPEIGYSRDERIKSARLKMSYAKILYEAGVIPICAFILGFREQREYARSLFDRAHYLECYLRCPADVCARRDPKGIYRKAASKEINNVVGIDLEYEEPGDPSLVIDTDKVSAGEAAAVIMKHIETKKMLERGQGIL